MGTLRILFRSIIGSDFYILVMAIFTFGVFVYTKSKENELLEDCKASKITKSQTLEKTFKRISKWYSVLITLISIFPLLGMFGTVKGLLGLDLANGNMENIKNNFFIALTSTAWGIIFSIIFKVAHAFLLENVEEEIATAKKILEKE